MAAATYDATGADAASQLRKKLLEQAQTAQAPVGDPTAEAAQAAPAAVPATADFAAAPVAPAPVAPAAMAPAGAVALPAGQQQATVNTTEPVARTTMAPAPTENATGGAEGSLRDIQAVNEFYRKYLGREANAEDAGKWLSGEYGHGTDLASIENAIRNSDEAQTVARKKGGGGATGGTASQYLLSLLQGGMDRDQAIQQTRQQYNLPEGVDGSPLYYANNNTIGLKDSYLANVNGQWSLVPRGNESGGGGNGGGGGGGGGGEGDTTYKDYLKRLMEEEAKRKAQQDEVRKILMGHLKQAGEPVNESDLNIAAPLSAGRDEAQRAQATERTALAERMYAQGGGQLNSNALTQAIQQSSERNAGGLSQLRAGLISKAYSDKQAQLQSDLQMAMASGDAESARLLQAQIAALGAAVQREGMGLSLAEFLAQLNQRTVSAGAGG